MSRGLTASMQTETAKAELRPAFFIELVFPSGTLNFWTGYGIKSWDSKSWNGSGDVIKISGIDETAAVEANGLQLQIDATDSGMVSLALTEEIQGRAVRLWVGMLDSSGAVIADPVGPFEYLGDQIIIDEAPPLLTITLTAESYLASLQRPRTRRLTHEDQQIEFPGDLGLEFVAQIQNKPIPWGSP